jgi:hypothetical protein
MTTIQTIGLVVLGVIVSVLFSVSMNGGENLAGVYELTDRTVPSITVTEGITVGSSSATSSTNLGRTCLTVYKYDGTAVYWYVNTLGNLATSSSSCN